MRVLIAMAGARGDVATFTGLATAIRAARVAGMATNTALAALGGLAREIRRELGLPRRGIREALSGEPGDSRWPVFYGFSPAVVPRPRTGPTAIR